MSISYKFSKEERLSSKKAIAELFDNGYAFTLSPFRVFWKESNTEFSFPAQMAVSVSKRNFKKAVDRNRIKRLMREAWRHNKHPLYKHLIKHKTQITMMLVYTSKEMPAQELISTKTEEVVSKLILISPDKRTFSE